MPKGLYLPEIVIEHEFGHQYWYGMVATNEFEDAWMDEGINSYTEAKVLDAILGKKTSGINMLGIYLERARAAAAGLHRRRRFGSHRPEGLRLLQFQLLRRHHLRENGERAADTGKHHRRRHDGQGHAHVFHEVSLHASHQGRPYERAIEEVSGKDLKWYFAWAI